MLACGDYPKTIEKHSWRDHILLGKVGLQNGDTYQSCRNLCRGKHPDFQFYHKFKNYQSCHCMKMAHGLVIAIQDHGSYSFGYSNECGMFIM